MSQGNQMCRFLKDYGVLSLSPQSSAVNINLYHSLQLPKLNQKWKQNALEINKQNTEKTYFFTSSNGFALIELNILADRLDTCI